MKSAKGNVSFKLEESTSFYGRWVLIIFNTCDRSQGDKQVQPKKERKERER